MSHYTPLVEFSIQAVCSNRLQPTLELLVKSNRQESGKEEGGGERAQFARLMRSKGCQAY